VIIGLSGGIDSALTLSIAVDALGAENVEALLMPSRFTADMSNEDACLQADTLGVCYETISIEQPFNSFLKILEPRFKGMPTDITEENIQARCRGILLMAASNKGGKLVLTTGNKSEMAVGYATLYGDMCGGFNALKDVYKTQVFELANWRNSNCPDGMLGAATKIVPQNVIDKPPSAELRDDQKDEDSLPPYDVLDEMLFALVEDESDIADLLAKGHSKEDVRRIENLLYLAEYKRRQAPPGVKMGPRSFGKDRRYPITNKYRDRGE